MLWTALGGGWTAPDPLPRLATVAELRAASVWGLAIRFGQRLSGGLARPLERSGLVVAGGTLTLRLDDAALYGEAVQKRHAALAEALGLRAVRA